MPAARGSPADRRDSARLLTVARQVKSALRKQRCQAITVTPEGKLRKTYTDGFSVKVGEFTGSRAGSLQLWLDRFTGQPNRTLQFCFASRKLDRIREIEAAASEVFGSSVIRNARNLRETAEGVLQMAPPLPTDEYNKPVLELYPDSGEGFYGVYVEPRSRVVGRRLVEQIAAFFSQAAWAVNKDDEERTTDRRVGFRRKPPETVQREAVDVAEQISAGNRKGGRQGIRITPRVRIALETHGMQRAREYLERSFPGYHIEDVHSTHSYDYQCIRGRQILHVEVKCTQSTGRGVFLTRNEVDLATRERKRMGLLIVANVKVHGTRTRPLVSGGTIRWLYPWDIADGTLEPIAFSYRLPD